MFAGIGLLRERQLWLSGIRRWSDVPETGDVLSPRLDDRLRADLIAMNDRGSGLETLDLL